MTTTFLVALLVSVLSTTMLAAVDLTGTWKLELNPDFSGHQQTIECAFKQDGQKFTADCGGATVKGEVKDRKVTFEHQTGKNNELTARYKANLDVHGTLMKGTWHLTQPENRDGKFQARKQ